MADDAQLHVTFSPSLAGGLRVALAQTGRTGQVVSTFDDLSFGPIASDDRKARLHWVEKELGLSEWDDG